jgi:hypothetical protein
MKTEMMAACALALSVAGCASSSKEISATYVSPVLYQNLSCDQLSLEAARVSSRAAQVAGIQDKNASGDAVKTGVGIILFWPTLFFLDGDGATAAELGRLRGEMDAIEQASIAKNCGIQFQKTAPPPKGKPGKATS